MPNPLSPAARQRLLQTLNSLPPPTFEEVLFVLSPPSGIVPGSQAPQGERAAALVNWAQSPIGNYLTEVYDLVASYVPELKDAIPEAELPGRQPSQQPATEREDGITINIINQPGDYRPMTQITNNNQGANIGNLVNEAKDNTQITASHFTQTSGTNTDELLQIINTLRQSAAQFPPEVQEDLIIDIDDVEEQVKKPEAQRNLPRLKKRLTALAAAASLVTGGVAAANEFADEVIELGSKVGIELQLPASSAEAD